MQKIFAGLLICLFVVNAYAVSAWAQPCMNFVDHQIAPIVMGSDMPCHKTVQEPANEQSNEPCGSACLCLHSTVNQAFMPTYQTVSIFPIISKQSISMAQNELISFDSSPPRRPPKIIS